MSDVTSTVQKVQDHDASITPDDEYRRLTSNEFFDEILENKERIQKMHSSPVETKIFTHQCIDGLWYKPCMFSKSQRKNDMFCHWCAWECERVGWNDFQLHLHIHCNGPAKKCGQNRSLEHTVAIEELQKSVAEPKIVFQKKMTQKERKAAAAKARAEAGL